MNGRVEEWRDVVLAVKIVVNSGGGGGWLDVVVLVEIKNQLKRKITWLCIILFFLKRNYN